MQVDVADLTHASPGPFSYAETADGWAILDARSERVAVCARVDIARALVAASRLLDEASSALRVMRDEGLEPSDLGALRRDAAKAEENAQDAEDRADDIEHQLDRARDALRDIRDRTSDDVIRHAAEEIVGKSEVASRPANTDLSKLAAK